VIVSPGLKHGWGSPPRNSGDSAMPAGACTSFFVAVNSDGEQPLAPAVGPIVADLAIGSTGRGAGPGPVWDHLGQREEFAADQAALREGAIRLDDVAGMPPEMM
jgi:hypothetical protein